MQVAHLLSELRNKGFPGAPFFALFAKGGTVLTLHFGQIPRLFHRYPQASSIALSVSPCHATNGEISNDARVETCGGPASFRGQFASPLKSAGSEEKANRNTCQIRNPCISLTAKDITISNRN
jgi:hypothetical protein